MSEPLTQEALDNVQARLEAMNPFETTYFRISWLPISEEALQEVSFIERPIVRDRVGRFRHAEISWPEMVGAFGFGAWGGRWPKLPDNAGYVARAKRWISKYLFTPPEGTRGTYIASHTYSTDSYEHRSYPCTVGQLLELWKTCRSIHGAGFNTSGYYWATFWPRTTTTDKFFCTEAGVYVLQKSGALAGIIPEDSEDAAILTMNPGSVTPSMLYDYVAPYGSEAMNYNYAVNDDFGQGTDFVFLGDSAMSEHEV